MPTSRFARFFLSGLTIAVATVIATPLASQGAVKNPSAATVLAAAAKALKSQTGVHIKVSTVSGKVDSSVVADLGTTSGTETYVSGDETFTIVVTPTYAYLSGSKTGLTTLMGLTSAEQKKVGSEAIAMKEGTTPYKTFQSNLTSSAFSELLPTAKGTTLESARDKATGGYQLSWATKATSSIPASTSVMVVSAKSPTLPLNETVTTANGKSHTTFTKWGEKVKVTKPSSTIAYASVFKS